jgi:DNA-binding HxlR family transcriptional regulator
VTKRAYGQYCGFARAAELVGERWALLIVRDLLVAPKRFSDLQRGLPRIPSNILTSRLKELEEAGIVRRRLQPRPSNGVFYELTEGGRDLEDAVLALGRWGAQRLGDPRPGEVVTEDALVMALRTTFQPEAAGRTRASYELRLGDIVINAQVAKGKASVAVGPLPTADLTIETGPALRMLLAREVSPEQALKKKLVRINGDPKLLDRFVRMFRIG